MSKVTSKLQVTVPKELADRYGIRPGSEIEWVPAGDSLRVIPGSASPASNDPTERLRLFDAASARQKKRQGRHAGTRVRDRGWTREDLYTRGLPR